MDSFERDRSGSIREVFLGLGANVGDPRRQILGALVDLSRALGPLRVAPLFRSRPESPIDQPDFLNTVVAAPAGPSPRDLLGLAKDLERRAGRRAGPRHGPRPLDVDVLVIEGTSLVEADLVVPHPSLRRRAFVLEPLARLAPELRLPPDDRSVTELRDALPDDALPTRMPWNPPPGD